MKRAFTTLFLVCATVAQGQEDPMETQRCVWACLANSNGADDPAYDMCVRTNCIADETARAPDVKSLPAWVLYAMDPANPPYLDGRAAVVSSADDQARLFYACGRGGDSYMTLQGVYGLSDFVGLSVNSTGIVGMPAEYFEGDLTFAATPRGAILGSLASGDWLDIQTSDRQTVARFGLTNAAEALNAAQLYCFGQ